MNGEGPNDPTENEPDDLPDPEFETIRNFSGLPDRIKERIRDGLFVALGASDDNAIRVSTLWSLLEHFEKLFHAVQVHEYGREVNRRGALAAVPGGRELEALPSQVSSYALPLRVTPPDGELVGHDYKELDSLMNLLAPSTNLQETLPELPERIGDELRQLYGALTTSGTDLRVEMVRDGQAVTDIEVGIDEAQQKAAWLDEKTPHQMGSKNVRGKLFRIDTKKSEIGIDVVGEDDGERTVESATFHDDQFDELREALNHQVEMEVSVTEDLRPYERSATTPKLTVNWVRRIEPEAEAR